MKIFKFFILFFSIILIVILLDTYYDYYKTVHIQEKNLINENIDIIVVLTGHRGRLKQGFVYLSQLKAKYLIISGANPKSLKKDILSPYKKYKNLFSKVIIESNSKNTKENAEELKKILDNFTSPLNILIITSTSHIKRAKFIFDKIFKNSKINITFASAPERITFKKILIEKIKYLFDYIYFFF